ncbi:MAG: hypothetical protein HYY20_08410 [Candidatus Tectomicrobia bacterium]|uniref:Uncharacterized protein n=1 Tax=Tectimicrobiota bacterium TaxID=2528274 RepID=A0A932CPA5_UNCTE|nr:hypothetical protein [Candidatus Tectomicrobia bacterium]
MTEQKETIMGLALKHFLYLLKDLVAYSWVNEVWWPLPLVLIIMAIGFLALTTQVATPYIYTLF